MKRFAMLLFLALPTCHRVHANENFSTTFDAQSGTIVVSTIPTAPTQVFTQGPYGFTLSVVVNPTAFNLFYSTSNVGISTTAASGAAGTTATTPYLTPLTSFSPDGPVTAYQGPLWAVLASTSATGTSPTPQAVIRNRIR